MKLQVYAGRIRDRAVLQYCSSGGAFIVLSNLFLNNGNAVLCSGYNYETQITEFRIIFSKEERDKCRGSMYMQSNPLDSWCKVTEWLISNPSKKLIFFGVGCQAAGFSKYMEQIGLRERITIVDLICHGAPSPLIWKDYISNIEHKNKIRQINFRDKRNGWNHSIAVAQTDEGEISLANWRSLYNSCTVLRPCCSKCPYTCVDRKTDITIGDFWHIENKLPDFYDEMGTSLFLIHTEKGAHIFELIMDQIEYKESNVQDCWQVNLEKPTQHSIERKTFWREYKRKGIRYVVKKYANPSIIHRVERKINREIIKLHGRM